MEVELDAVVGGVTKSAGNQPPVRSWTATA